MLIAGAGGGFDVYAGLPIALALRDAGKEVFFANLTFTYLGGTNAPWIAPRAVIEALREELTLRPRRAIPH